MRKKGVFIKAALTKILVFKGNFSKNMVRRGQMSIPAIAFGGNCPLMPFFMEGQMSGRAFVRTLITCILKTAD